MKKNKLLLLLILCFIVLIITSIDNIVTYSNDDLNNSYTYYGYYPQSLLEDEIIYDSLYFNSLENEPEFLNWYKYANDYYAKIETDNIGEDVYFSNGDQVLNHRIYFFKVEKIKWKLNKNVDYYELNSVKVIDASNFYNVEQYDRDTFLENSNINLLMQNYFIPAFGLNCELLINYVINSSSVYRDCFENFQTNVHLPIYEQSQENNQSLTKEATDYAIARGVTKASNGNSEYWLEMIGNNNFHAIYTTASGETLYNKKITEILGIAPCVRVKRGAV